MKSTFCSANSLAKAGLLPHIDSPMVFSVLSLIDSTPRQNRMPEDRPRVAAENSMTTARFMAERPLKIDPREFLSETALVEPGYYIRVSAKGTPTHFASEAA